VSALGDARLHRRTRPLGRRRALARQQEGHFLDDGSYQLRVPYSNDPELIMDVLKYGPDCQVVEPAELREKVKGLAEGGGGEVWE
jgi:predicted DNA-binding transcriptional regulator YafY